MSTYNKYKKENNKNYESNNIDLKYFYNYIDLTRKNKSSFDIKKQANNNNNNNKSDIIQIKNNLNFLDFLHNNKSDLKSKIYLCSFNFNYEIIDLSLCPKGIDEEDMYLNNNAYLKNICRGNTLILKRPNEFLNYIKDEYIKNNNKNLVESKNLDQNFISSNLNLILIRKGLRKFLNLKLEFITLEDNKYLSTEHIKNQNDLKTRDIIISPIIKCLESNKKIKIYKMIKANGENAQISYCNELSSWVICSKNVSMLVRNKDDLNFYQKNNRFYFAFLIGICWFSIIDNLDSRKKNELINFLIDHTLIGEYVGNQYHQHLVRYVDHNILFYAIVHKTKQNHVCLSVLESLSILTYYNLKTVSIEEIGVFNSYKDTCSALEILYNRIAESSIIDEEEGSVLYICSLDTEEEYNNSNTNNNANDLNVVDYNNCNEEVLTLCKLKTFEYKVYRKLREKITNHLLRDKEDRYKINQYFEEVRLMLSGYLLPNPIEFYYKLAETAFGLLDYIPNDVIENTKIDQAYFRNCYLDFIETVLKLINRNTGLKTQAISNKTILTKYNLTNKNNNLDTIEQSIKYIEIFMYMPPYLKGLDNLLKDIVKNFKLSISNEEFNYKNEDKFYSDSIKINLIYWHEFRNITKLNINQFLIIMDLNILNSKELSFEITKVLNDKIQNSQYINYITDSSLKIFFTKSLNTIKNNKNKESTIKAIEETFSNYVLLSNRFISVIKKYINDNNYFSVCSLDIEDNRKQLIDWILLKYKTIFKKEFKLCTNNENNNISSNLIIKENELNKKNIILENNSDKKLYSNNTTDSKNNFIDNRFKDFISIYNNYKNPFEECSINYSNDQNFKLNKNTDKYNNIQKNIVNYKYLSVLIPMTLPGTGKTDFVTSLSKLMSLKNILFLTISSDKIRKKLINEYKSYYKCSEDEAFSKTGKKSNKIFENELISLINEFMESKNNKCLLYIDKNHPPNAISRSME